MVTATVKFGHNLLEINKVNDEYEVLTSKIDDVFFVCRIRHLLFEYADVFAAYYNSLVFENDIEKMLIINNFEKSMKTYDIFAIKLDPTTKKHNWGAHYVKEQCGDFTIGKDSYVAEYLGYLYLFHELEREKDKVIISIDKNYKKLINITSHDDKYYVMLNGDPTTSFITTVTENLYKYGHVFAAYIKSIEDSISHQRIVSKVYWFSSIVGNMDIKIINLKSSTNSASFYGNSVYIFSTPPKVD